MLLTNEKELQGRVATFVHRTVGIETFAALPQPYKPREKVHTFAGLTPARLRPS
jgi:hypothetical protein